MLRPLPTATDTVEATVAIPSSGRLAHTLSPLRRGPYDPAFRQGADGATWYTAHPQSGPVTARLIQSGAAVHCHAWGPGAREFTDGLSALTGGHDDPAGFDPAHPVLAEARRRHPGFRLARTGRVWEALVPAILEQRVHSVAAYASWRRLLIRFGEPAPGPAPDGMRVAPPPAVWRRIPSWEFHRANVDPRRAQTIVRCARVADQLEATAGLPADEAARRLQSLTGVGVWTAAEVVQRSHGDPDAISVGDYHLAATVGWTLLGHPLDDAGMLDYLEPLRPHRQRAIRLIHLSGLARRPRFGPRTPIMDHRGR